MARFVLVHGGFSGAWIWLPLIDTLREAGHVVEAFDLPGMGDDHTSASEVSLDSYAGRVCEVLAANSEPAIVVGHSMGGIVATQGAARCPERVAALVYVAAFLPKDGQSLLDLTKLPEGDGEQVLANVLDCDEAGKIRLLRLSGIRLPLWLSAVLTSQHVGLPRIPKSGVGLLRTLCFRSQA